MHVRLTFQATSDGWVGLQVLHVSNGVHNNESEARVLTGQRTAMASERKTRVREADKQSLHLSPTGTALVPSQPQLAPLPSLPPLPAVIGGAHQGEKNTYEERSRPRTSFAEDPLALSAISYTTRFVPTPSLPWDAYARARPPRSGGDSNFDAGSVWRGDVGSSTKSSAYGSRKRRARSLDYDARSAEVRASLHADTLELIRKAVRRGYAVRHSPLESTKGQGPAPRQSPVTGQQPRTGEVSTSRAVTAPVALAIPQLPMRPAPPASGAATARGSRHFRRSWRVASGPGENTPLTLTPAHPMRELSPRLASDMKVLSTMAQGDWRRMISLGADPMPLLPHGKPLVYAPLMPISPRPDTVLPDWERPSAVSPKSAAAAWRDR